MGYSNILSDNSFTIGDNMNNSVVLNTASFFNNNPAEITTQHCAKPDAGVFFNNNITNQGCIWGNKSIMSHLGNFIFKFNDHRSSPHPNIC